MREVSFASGEEPILSERNVSVLGESRESSSAEVVGMIDEIMILNEHSFSQEAEQFHP